MCHIFIFNVVISIWKQNSLIVPQTRLHPNPWNLWVLPYVAEVSLQMILSYRFWDREMILDWGQSLTRILIWKKGQVIVKAEKRCYAAGFEGGGRDHKPKTVGSLQTPQEVRNRFSCGASRRKAACQHLGLWQRKVISDFWPPEL